MNVLHFRLNFSKWMCIAKLKRDKCVPKTIHFHRRHIIWVDDDNAPSIRLDKNPFVGVNNILNGMYHRVWNCWIVFTLTVSAHLCVIVYGRKAEEVKKKTNSIFNTVQWVSEILICWYGLFFCLFSRKQNEFVSEINILCYAIFSICIRCPIFIFVVTFSLVLLLIIVWLLL